MPKPKSRDEDDFELVEIEDEASDDTLERAPERVSKMLRGIANNPVALAKLVERGYSAESHKEGWELLAPCHALPSAATPILVDKSTSDAIAALDEWDNQHFAIIASALARKHAAQRKALFDKLAPAEGAASVLAVETLLNRLAQLAKGTLTKDATKDKAANEYLVRRGYTGEVRKQLSAQVEAARALPAFSAKGGKEQAAEDEARREALAELHGWWREWATVAKKAIQRRDLLINLGLARRKPPTPAPAPAA
jgi:hypothetical protein